MYLAVGGEDGITFMVGAVFLGKLGEVGAELTLFPKFTVHGWHDGQANSRKIPHKFGTGPD